MADFRKWLIAFAAVAVLLSLSTSAFAQSGIVTCTTSTNTLFVRSEGKTELVQDFVLQCTGGTATPGAGNVPSASFTFTMSGGTLTSRLESLTGLSEALLLVGDPLNGAAGNVAVAQVGCNTTTTNCDPAANGTGGGINTAANSDNVYNGVGTHFNMFQGLQSGIGVSYTGVPFDPPGTSTETIRVTNIRATPSAANAAVVGTLTIGQISNASVSVTFPSGNSETLAIATPSLSVSTKAPKTKDNNALAIATGSLVQCIANLSPQTTFLLASQVSLYAPVTVSETFAGAWKVRSTGPGGVPTGGGLGQPTVGGAPSNNQNPASQSVPGNAVGLGTESGFTPTSSTGLTTGATAPAIGQSDTGTQLSFTINGIPSADSIFVNNIAPLTNAAGAITGWAVLTTYNGSLAINATTTASTTQLAVTAGTAVATYEIFSTTNSAVETLTVNVTPVYTANLANSATAAGAPATVTVSYAPLATTLPNFTATGSPNPVFTIGTCTCNLLFPYVTDQNGFDTGIAVANTTVDPFLTPAQTGTVAFNFYPTVASGATASTQTSAAVAAGDQVTFSLFNGGDHGIAAIKGFTGYIIAQAGFQFCHGFAFISDLGAKNLAMGYLALDLDYNALGTPRGSGVGEALIH